MTDIIRVAADNPDPTAIARAAECLRSGGLVAFPTETVYGLGVNALDRAAVQRLFAAKQRPLNDPLIIHVGSFESIAPLVSRVPKSARSLARHFWPGPLTMIFPRSARVPDEVTAGLPNVAVRVPAHPVARALIDAAAVPVAAPSANLFSRPSPTRAAHVLADLNGRIDLIVDGGATEVGLESTVIDLSGRVPTILRPGAIDLDALRQVIPDVISGRAAGSPTAAMASPGMLPKHYSPRTPVLLYEGDRESALVQMKRDTEQRISRGESIVVLSYTEDVTELRNLGVRILDLAPESNPVAVAARLYAALRECDELGAAAILVRTITTRHPLTGAIQDRLRRAATVATPDT